MAKKEQNKQGYTAEDIYVLEGLEPVRKRPGMYIGSTGSEGLHHLIWEVIDNGIDEAMAGHADTVTLELEGDRKVRVSDNGRGIPVDTHERTGKSALETVMTTLHAGGKFGGKSYQVAGGLHGVGVSVVTALSKYAKATICRDNVQYEQEYAQGAPQGELKELGECDHNGTTIEFEPDPEIFFRHEKPDGPIFSLQKIFDHLRRQAYLTPSLSIVVKDNRENRGEDMELAQEYTFYFEGGIRAFVQYLNRGETGEHEEVFYTQGEEEGVFVETALQYTEDLQSNVLAFANNIATPEGGMHLTGFKTALTAAINDFAVDNGHLKDNERLSGNDVQEGLTAVVSVKLPDPQFEGQTKAKLGSTEARAATRKVVYEGLQEFFKKDPRAAQSIIDKAVLARQARQKAKAVRETIMKKGALSNVTLPGKLTDCSQRDPEKTELFILEGDSAGGSAKAARDPKTQAILPLRGKVLNVERARLKRILEFKEIKALIVALGTAIAEEFDVSKLRYHKIIIATDRDVDGEHIATLLLTLFYRYFRPIIEGGHLYIAQAPLYKMTAGQQVEYAYSERERKEVLSRFDNPDKVEVQRYKGLGEMNAEELWETTMDPENRVLKQMTIEDAAKADELFDKLMGSEVPPRRKFIQTHAAEVSNLDV